MKKLALNLLCWLAKLVAEKYQVKIVAITGSVGKTTTKEAVFAVLRQAYDAQRSLHNTNTEWGIAASVISPGFEPVFTPSGKARITLPQFFSLCWQAKLKLLFQMKYPTVLVLELAADRPGDIKWFNRWFKYDVAVITTIGGSHLEFYQNQAALTAEKLSLTDKLKPSGLVIINGECAECQTFIRESKKRKITFGWERSNDFWVEDKELGTQYILHSPTEAIEVGLPPGRQFALSALAAFALGEEFGLTADQIRQGLSSLQAPSGRFEIKQTNRWVVIDDTYNASPESMRAGLQGLREIARGRKVAILGGMRELGPVSDTAHRQVGEWAAELADLLIVVGKEGELIAAGAIEAGMPISSVVKLAWDEYNPDIDRTLSQLLPILEDGDSVLVKASRAIHLDQLADRLLAYS